MPGYAKIEGCCAQARADGWEYAWVDSCCIDKSSSAELSEAINSMFKWYRNAQVCYAFLDDVDGEEEGAIPGELRRSMWFTRGWTLQELLAPDIVVFFDKNWMDIGTKTSLGELISEITGIEDLFSWEGACIAQKMSWAAKRKTTRTEDMAYCLMGLFDVNMPPLYGEGNKAFMRLQMEIIKSSDDESFLAWSLDDHEGDVFARSPLAFKDSGQIRRCRGHRESRSFFQGERRPFAMTNKGLHISMLLIPSQALPSIADESSLGYIGLLHGFCTVNNANVRPAILLEAVRLSSRGPEEHCTFSRFSQRVFFLDVDDVKEKIKTWNDRQRPQSGSSSGAFPSPRSIYLINFGIVKTARPASVTYGILVDCASLYRHHFNPLPSVPFPNIDGSWSLRYGAGGTGDAVPILITYDTDYPFDFPHVYFTNSTTRETILLGAAVVTDAPLSSNRKFTLILSTVDSLTKSENLNTPPHLWRLLPSSKIIFGADRISHPLRNGMSVSASLSRIGGNEGCQYRINLTVDPTGAIRWPPTAKILDQTAWLGRSIMAYNKTAGLLQRITRRETRDGGEGAGRKIAVKRGDVDGENRSLETLNLARR